MTGPTKNLILPAKSTDSERSTVCPCGKTLNSESGES
jgi:hypothetical protein